MDKGRKKYDIMPMLPRTFAYAFAYFRPYGTTPSPSFVRTYTATATHHRLPITIPTHHPLRTFAPALAYMCIRTYALKPQPQYTITCP